MLEPTVQLRWKNFRNFEDTGFFEVRPLTLLIGANACGKTSLHAPLVMMKQTLRAADSRLALKTRGDDMDVGPYRDFVHNHDVERDVEFSIRFHVHADFPNSTAKPIGDEPPGALDLSFRHSDNGETSLHRYSVSDQLLRPMMVRQRLASGLYSLRGFLTEAARPSEAKGEIDRVARSAIRNSHPANFLFDSSRPFAAAVRKLQDMGDDAELQFSEKAGTYLSIVSFVSASLDALIGDMSYLGPLRQRPRRVHAISPEPPNAIGSTGENTAELLLDSPLGLVEEISERLRDFGYKASLTTDRYRDDAFSLLLSEVGALGGLNYADAGFGLSQLLPLVVEAMRMRKDSWFVVEQPEIHLNPKLQAELGSFFVERAKSGRTMIIETHSEHLLLRVRRLVAEGMMPSSDVAVYYVEKAESGFSSVRRIPLEENGHIDADAWPTGFFADGTLDALEMAKAQLRAPGPTKRLG